MTLADVRFSQRGRTLIGQVVGELDMSNAEAVGTAVTETMSPDTESVVLDLSDVAYLDSAGIYVIFGMRENLRARGHKLALVVPDGSPVNDALRLAGVQRHTPVAATVEDALAGIEAGPAKEG